MQPGEGAARPPRAGPLEARRPSPLERGAAEGESPVRPRAAGPGRRSGGASLDESGSLGVLPKAGGKLLPRLNTGRRPIAHK